jgi:hypothetical protein
MNVLIPGSEEKLLYLQARAARGLPLFEDGEAEPPPDPDPRLEARRRYSREYMRARRAAGAPPKPPPNPSALYLRAWRRRRKAAPGG